MKTTLCFIFTLLTFVMFTFVPNCFAQTDSPEFVVRVTYFIPNDREPDPNMDEKLDTLIKDTQQFYADEMERHGFGRKTFRFESDTTGNALVHHVEGKFNNAHYDGVEDLDVYIKELDEYFDTSKNIYTSKNIDLIIVYSKIFCGYAPLGKFAFVNEADCVTFRVIAHELGHTFRLAHDWRDNVYIMSYGGRYRSELSLCAAERLNLNPYFNPTQGPMNYNTSVQMLPPILATSPDAIRLRFQVSDPDGLYLFQLGTFHDFTLESCKFLQGEYDTIIEFTTTEFPIKENNPVVVNVLDIHGNIRHAEFTIDVNDLLPHPEVILIPDKNLAAAVRNTLKLEPNSTITQLDMLNLTYLIYELKPEHNQIMNLTGLEHAKNLSTLYLSSNQIVDLTPITGLKRLTSLDLNNNQIDDLTPITGMTRLKVLNLDRNPILDFTPLTTLTRLHALSLNQTNISNTNPIVGVISKLSSLRSLYLNHNQISDITPLTGLTELRELSLRNNQISDVSPLSEFVNLRELHLEGNPIKDRKPLLELLEKNPDVKIYLKRGGEPLPVTLSHFRAERSNAGVILKWTTESEVDNAGFYIHRSETKDGEFKVVNPTMIQGAGTTGERNEYTWTDTTAKENTVYYYQIEDVSYAGVRKQLATVRLRGLVSASGKLATSWGDLKRTQ